MALPRFLRHAGVWLALAALAAAAYSFRDEARYVGDRIGGDLAPAHGFGVSEGEISFRAGAGGHFLVRASVGGVPLAMIVDTGASDVILTARDARRLGLDPERLAYTRAYRSANGTVMAAPVTLPELRIGPIRVEGVRAAVNRAPMETSLLGLSFLSRIGGYAVRGDRLTLYAGG